MAEAGHNSISHDLIAITPIEDESIGCTRAGKIEVLIGMCQGWRRTGTDVIQRSAACRARVDMYVCIFDGFRL